MSLLDYLTESKFRELPQTIENEAEKIAELYLNGLNRSGDPVSKEWEKYFKRQKESVDFIKELGVVRFKDLQTEKMRRFRVFVAYGENNNDLAIADTDRRHIILYDSNCRELSKGKLISTIYHEIVHGFQQHKSYSKNYKRGDRSAYYAEPVEFDAFMTELAFVINKEFTKIKNDINNSKLPQTKKIMEKRLEKFLKELKVFIRSPFETYFIYNELPLPSSFQTFEEMLENINDNPKLRRLFKMKLLNLYGGFIKQFQ